MKSQIEFSQEKYISKILFDSDKVRMVLFCLGKGQEVPAHTVESQVVMVVLTGKGLFIVGDKTYTAKQDTVVICKSNEAHGMKAEEQMAVLACIIPRP